MKLKFIFCFLISIPIVIVYKAWFMNDFINSGDFINFTFKPSLDVYAWGNGLNGLGGSMFAYGWLSLVASIPLSLLNGLFEIDIIFAQKIAFFYSFIALSVISSLFLFKKLFKDNNFYYLAPLFFLFNTYVLMLVGGGQIFIALSLAFLPITVYLYINELILKKIEDVNKISLLKKSLLIGLLLTIQIMLDLRIGYIALFAILVFLLVFNLIKLNRKIFIRSLFLLFIPLFIVLLLNLYWVLPIIVVGQNPIEQLGAAYSTVSGVVFFSFAKFENTISLLHPNWPENIFGKVYFLKPEFVVLPLLVFSSLLFIEKISKKERFYILYFSLIGLIGAFLAKGSNEPFGCIYLWLFDNFPGMQMFRDPTKFYTLVVLSYSMLIPFSVSKIYEKISKFSVKNKILNYQNLFLVIVVCYLLYLINPALLGKLNGTFRPSILPNEYVKLKEFVASDNNFYRTLWIPSIQRYGINTNQNPAISSLQFFNTSSNSALFSCLNKPELSELLKQASVKYVVVPYDSEGEIFLEDRKYSEEEYLKTVGEIEKIDWLTPVGDFEKIKVFELANPKDHFWIMGDGEVNYKYVSSVEYKIKLSNVKINDILVFSESFDRNWSINVNNLKAYSQEYELFNSFKLDKSGTYSASIYYEPQKYVNIGLIVSGSTLILIIFLFGFGYVTKKW